MPRSLSFSCTGYLHLIHLSWFLFLNRPGFSIHFACTGFLHTIDLRPLTTIVAVPLQPYCCHDRPDGATHTIFSTCFIYCTYCASTVYST
ncbi:hypothetical protein K523DRAFT_323463 [Schizophyllum commune Tattone D]|nr:hypothetical protein K523DRAFT_323463 [Schizophyllum commune Tattone D]